MTPIAQTRQQKLILLRAVMQKKVRMTAEDFMALVASVRED